MLLLLFNSYNIFAFPSKAVLLLGGKLGASKTQFEKELLHCKEILEENAVSVSYFSSSTNSWREIAAESSEADIFIYSGHGVSFGGNYGGFLLASGQIISPDQIQRDLHFNKNALVFFLHTCGSAGSSASDLSPVSEKLAQNRVINYANPFIKSGAAAVVAINWNDQILSFLNDLLYTVNVDTVTTEEGDTVYLHTAGNIGDAYLRICNELNQSLDISAPLSSNNDMTVYLSHNDPRFERVSIAALDESGKYMEYYRTQETGKKGPITYELSFVGDSNFRW